MHIVNKELDYKDCSLWEAELGHTSNSVKDYIADTTANEEMVDLSTSKYQYQIIARLLICMA